MSKAFREILLVRFFWKNKSNLIFEDTKKLVWRKY